LATDQVPPCGGRREMFQNLFPVGDRLVFNGPPKEKWDLRIIEILPALQELPNDGQGVLAGQALATTSELIANDAARIVPGDLYQSSLNFRCDAPGLSEQTNRPGPDIGIGMIEQFKGQGIIETAADIDRPERFKCEPISILQGHLVEPGNDGLIPSLG